MGNFKVSIKSRRFYRLGKPVYIDVCIQNTTNRDYYLKTKDTVLDGIPGDCFEVIWGGRTLPYDGILVKRLDKGISDMRLIKAGEKNTMRICLSELYPLYKSGKYRVKVKTQQLEARSSVHGMTDILREKENLTDIIFSFRLFGRRKMHKTAGDELRSWDKIYPFANVDYNEPIVEFYRMDPREKEEAFKQKVRNAHYEMIYYLQTSTAELQTFTEKEKNFHYQFAFGQYDESRYNRIEAGFSDILDKMKHGQVTYKRNRAVKYEDCIAYTAYNTDTVYISRDFYDLRLSGEDSHLGSLFREWIHAVKKTEDVRYGRDNCLELARDRPELAIINADNYELYMETQFLNWKQQGLWPGGGDIAAVPAGGGPSLAVGKDKLYLFYCSNENKIKYAVSDGTEFSIPGALVCGGTNTKHEISSLFHPEIIKYGPSLYLFYIPAGSEDLYYTCLNLGAETEGWSEGIPLTDKAGNRFKPEYPPQPVIYKKKIVLLYKKENEDGYFGTCWSTKDNYWYKETAAGDSPLVETERYNPATAVINGRLCMVYCSSESAEIKYASYNEEFQLWNSYMLERNSDLEETETTYEMRCSRNGEAVYLFMRHLNGDAAQIQVNFLEKRKQLLWTDGEKLKNNTFTAECPEVEGLCSFAKLGGYNYMVGRKRLTGGICYAKQITGFSADSD